MSQQPRRVSATALAKMGVCEVQILMDATHGKRQTRQMAQLSREGDRVHEAAYKAEIQHQRAGGVGPAMLPGPNRDSRCFVATAVFGTDAPETQVLRQYRDASLKKTKTGRALVALYYKLSPPLARWLPHHPGVSQGVAFFLRGIVGLVAKRHEKRNVSR